MLEHLHSHQFCQAHFIFQVCVLGFASSRWLTNEEDACFYSPSYLWTHESIAACVTHAADGHCMEVGNISCDLMLHEQF